MSMSVTGIGLSLKSVEMVREGRPDVDCSPLLSPAAGAGPGGDDVAEPDAAAAAAAPPAPKADGFTIRMIVAPSEMSYSLTNLSSFKALPLTSSLCASAAGAVVDELATSFLSSAIESVVDMVIGIESAGLSDLTTTLIVASD